MWCATSLTVREGTKASLLTVTAIHQQSTPCQWRYVGRKMNPTNNASRGLSAKAIIASSRWKKGPEFLWLFEEKWPQMPAAIEEEVKQKPLEEVATTLAIRSCPPDYDVAEVFKRLLPWYSLKRFVAWILRSEDWSPEGPWARGSWEKSSRLSKVTASATSCHPYRALLRRPQNSLKEKSVKRSSHICQLDPVLLRGVIFAGSCLQHSPISEDAKHPAILPKQHHVSDLIICHYHLRWGHSGLQRTLIMIRERYWIVQARVSLRRVLNGCFHCKRTQASTGQRKMANLPKDRVYPLEPPFSHVGVDCFGPLLVCRARSTVKRYGPIYLPGSHPSP